ncbi:hypothetical protein D6C93_05011 [Aureobasidium pullulans]|uniref:Mediator of RNA polymerase II transcription subunit 18 n=1 Tax=Aureobasidium pullulans TaxID=5580 RepID=A0A4S9RGS2_AURPU|nr:hypothetical protein D6D24_06960 [Aureobasidium pullulans]THY95544.1 hypothetical protein D6C93_05011 [Aureobasidium pullulans]
MHELLLYGQVPVERHEQVLKILAGIAAMQPRILFERHLIYRPLRSMQDNKPNKKFPNKPVKPQTLTFQHLVRQLEQSEFGKDSPILLGPENNENASQPTYAWRIKTQETPEPETKTLVLRQATEAVFDNEQLRTFLDPANNGFVSEFLVEGHRFVHKNTVLTLFRILRASDMPQQTPLTSLPALESLKPLDTSGAFVLEACVRIDDRTKPNLVSTASDELNAFRDMMKGSVEMRVPERLSLDTRVR